MVAGWGCESQSQYSFPSRTHAKTIWYVLVLLATPPGKASGDVLAINLVWFILYSAVTYTCINHMTAGKTT